MLKNKSINGIIKEEILHHHQIEKIGKLVSKADDWEELDTILFDLSRYISTLNYDTEQAERYCQEKVNPALNVLLMRAEKRLKELQNSQLGYSFSTENTNDWFLDLTREEKPIYETLQARLKGKKFKGVPFAKMYPASPKSGQLIKSVTPLEEHTGSYIKNQNVEIPPEKILKANDTITSEREKRYNPVKDKVKPKKLTKRRLGLYSFYVAAAALLIRAGVGAWSNSAEPIPESVTYKDILEDPTRMTVSPSYEMEGTNSALENSINEPIIYSRGIERAVRQVKGWDKREIIDNIKRRYSFGKEGSLIADCPY